ncbi:MAG: site-specific integrase [Xanthomonadales bacterium]|nr:site-specific integrase [Xanthomonadales bacterium]
MARQQLKDLCPNMYTFQTQLSKLKRWLEKRALPEEVTKQFKLTDEEFAAYTEHKKTVDEKKAQRLGLVSLDASDHDAWDLKEMDAMDIEYFLRVMAEPHSTHPSLNYIKVLIVSGRRGQDLFQARFEPVEGKPTWARIHNACKARQAELRSYEFPLLCSYAKFEILLDFAREGFEEFKRAQFYNALAQVAIGALLDQWDILKRAAAGRPVTPHRLRKLYAALLLRCYDTHPLGADEFLRRAFNHKNAATKVYFPSSGASVNLSKLFPIPEGEEAEMVTDQGPCRCHEFCNEGDYWICCKCDVADSKEVRDNAISFIYKVPRGSKGSGEVGR